MASAVRGLVDALVWMYNQRVLPAAMERWQRRRRTARHLSTMIKRGSLAAEEQQQPSANRQTAPRTSSLASKLSTGYFRRRVARQHSGMYSYGGGALFCLPICLILSSSFDFWSFLSFSSVFLLSPLRFLLIANFSQRSVWDRSTSACLAENACYLSFIVT